jgi:hypothetical protein
MLPNFIIIGAQKSASTFIHFNLSEHPDVFMPSEEITFFENPDYWQSDIESFERLFEKGCHKKAIGIKRPSYLHKPECPERIHRHIPSARLIAILRNPVERAISAYYHYIKMGFAPVKPANKGLLEIIYGEHEEQYPRATEIIEFGLYHKHLSRYLNYFDREQMLIMLYDDIKKSPLDSLKEISRFLEIDEEYVPQSLHSRPQAGVYSIPRLRLLTLRNPFMYSYSNDRMRLSAKKLGKETGLLGLMIIAAITLIDNEVLSRIFANTKPDISRELAEMLSATYEEDTSKLEDLLGISLARWRVYQ